MFGTLGAMGWLRRADRAGGGLCGDIGLYAASALFAWWTAGASTLAPHRAWGSIAALGFATAAAVTSVPLLLRRPFTAANRVALLVAAWVAVCVAPLVIEALQRSAGRADRAQEEVMVIEEGGRRLLETGTPYLSRAAIAALPEPLLGYLPYQPGMAVFGLPRALDTTAAWWSDARVWFALATVGTVVAGLEVLRGAGAAHPGLVRALQTVTVLPVAALTLATGGDDLPVLALCLLAFALAATQHNGGAGLAIGTAAALKLFAWPVALVLTVYAFTRGHRAGLRLLAGALGVPLVTSLPALTLDPGALVENVVAFPFGLGLVTSPAASPLPGHLIATGLPAGDLIAKVLLALAALAVLILLVRKPPRTADQAALISGLALLGAMLLLPATRFGYLLYPAAMLVWVPSLRESRLARSERKLSARAGASLRTDADAG